MATKCESWGVKCLVCEGVTEIDHAYSDWVCTHCGQRYVYDEDQRIELTQEQVAMLRGRTRWISVTERLPDRYVNVLVYAPFSSERTYIASLTDGGMWFSSDPEADAYTLGEDGAPTHWMPLPAPPAMPRQSGEATG
jgi:DNA-directed RNA polymerase subunit RPC12/RpoP